MTIRIHKGSPMDDIYLGKAYLHAKSGRVCIETDTPDEEHNCDEMGCGTVGGHIIQWLESTRPDAGERQIEPKTYCEKHQWPLTISCRKCWEEKLADAGEDISPSRTPNANLPPLDPNAPKRKMLIEIEVAADFEKRLDNQWMVEREIHADRWAWRWGDQNLIMGLTVESLVQELSSLLSKHP